MLAAILSQRGPVLKTNGNMNTPGPVRRTLLQLGRRHWAAVLEIAFARPGYVARSSRMARPTSGIVTNVGLALLNAGDPGTQTLLIDTTPKESAFWRNPSGWSWLPLAVGP